MILPSDFRLWPAEAKQEQWAEYVRIKPHVGVSLAQRSAAAVQIVRERHAKAEAEKSEAVKQ